MSKIAFSFIAASAVFAGAVGIAGPMGGGIAAAFGASAETVTSDDAARDAARLFNRADMDANGVVDVEEYAALEVVEAELARLNRAVVIDGVSLRHIELPAEVADRLSAGERARVDAVARREFHVWSDTENGLAEEAFVALRLARFDAADGDQNGRLQGDEMRLYAQDIAQHRPLVG